jgi:hypothetical protein
VITNKRTSPLTAHDAVAAESADLEASVVPVAAHTLTGAAVDERDRRFVDGVRTLRVGGATIKLNERILLVLGGIIAPIGLALVLLGYWGAANTPYLFEQVSYLISGGLFGLALVFLGAFFYFAHWLTQLVKEHRVQSVAMLEAIQRLQEEVAGLGAASVTPAPSRNGRSALPEADPVALVATSRGTMAHHPTCVVVAGKDDLRTVTAADGLAPCKLCEPYG